MILALSLLSVNAVAQQKHAYVDLGLPSGTKWATCNVGAKVPQDYGSYFAWGETSPKSFFNVTSYKLCKGEYYSLTKYNTSSYYGTVDNKTELELNDDAAHVNWGEGWRIPSKAQIVELINPKYTKSEWKSLNGVKGLKITSKKNGKSIFLPASDMDYAGLLGQYWSRTLGKNGGDEAWAFFFNLKGYVSTSNDDRNYGHSVRSVRR